MSEPKHEPNGTGLRDFLLAALNHWTALMSGGIITVLLGVFERLSGKNVPLWVYASIIALFVFIACYLAWRDERRKVISLTEGSHNRYRQEFLAERLRALMDRNEAIRLSPDHFGSIFLRMGHTEKIKAFLGKYYDPDIVQQFNEKGIGLLEELLADCYRSGGQEITKSNTKSLGNPD